MTRAIKLRGVSQHNLKGFDLDIPLHKVVCVTGVSGAGKSSLAFDVLYAEGQRRYVETFSTYLRQYLERLPRPQVKSIENIPPAIAVEQTNPVKSSRSTVGTLAEITHFAKMLYFRESIPFCPYCHREIKGFDPEQVASLLLERYPAQLAIIVAPVKARDPNLLKSGLLASGFFRIFLANRIADLEEIEDLPSEIEVVLDRIKISPSEKKRLIEALEQGFNIARLVKIYLPYGRVEVFSKEARCHCGYEPPKKTPNLFSFNSPIGACPQCRGFGRVIDIDWDLVVPDKNKSLAQGAITLLELPSLWEEKEELLEYCEEKDIPLTTAWKDLPEETRQRIIYGDGKWYGLKSIFDWLESKKYKAHIRILLARYRAYLTCPACHGTRFKPEALVYRLNGLNIAEFYALSVSRAVRFFEEILSQDLDKASQLLAKEIYNRLSYLDGVGLSYLTLDRQSRTLSGGEVARVLLTRALSSELVETLYIFDEPTTGLHPRDVHRIISFLRRLAERKNSVLVVEHDPEIILSSDVVLDLGPGPGEKGGFLLFVGESKALLKEDTPTAQALRDFRRPKTLTPLVEAGEDFLEIYGAEAHNLQKIDVRFPLRGISVITGVSGSGKSTLLERIIYRGIKRLKGEGAEPPGRFREIKGYEKLKKVILLDQTPLARSPRANPATYLKAYDPLRKLLASTQEAKEAGLSPSAFSFNSRVGQCPHCQGLGFEVVEMQFLSDLYFPCPICQGRRFREEILSIRWKGKNVSEFLEMTCNEALSFFDPEGASSPQEEKLLRQLRQRLEAASKVGLGYLRLGQPLSTLSGGEAQRLKIAHHLFLEKEKGALFLLDEPSIGLHSLDLENLLQALKGLVKQGNGVILVEHNLEVVRQASWLVDLGPEGGEEGGKLLYQGPPGGLLEIGSSHTAKWLRKYLEGQI